MPQNSEHIPTLADLALKYKTITRDQYTHLNQLVDLQKREGKSPDYKELLIEQRMATSYQIDLLQLIRDYHIIRYQGETFGKIAIAKGFATEEDIHNALEIQKKEFKKSKLKKLMGEILVSMEVITTAQKKLILEVQGRQIKTMEGKESPAVKVSPTQDGMAAWIELTPKKASTISISDIKSVLAKEGITEGIYPDVLLKCRLEEAHTRFPVARQDFSQALKDARHLESLFNINLSETGEKRRGDLLVRQAPTWHRIKRVNIYGKATFTESPLDYTINCGVGTRRSKDKTSIVAAKTGTPMLSVLRSLFVHPAIHVLEDVDQRYGAVEPYANLTVTGTITGAHPVTAGHINAREIRGAMIDAIGTVTTSVGMTDATIKAQGDVRARYLHNCRIETYGNVYVDNEIFDSDIRCSGKLDSPACRIINSSIYAKQGVCILGAGSEKTGHCNIIAGGEHHIVSVANALDLEMQSVSRELEDLKREYDGQKSTAGKLFRDMAELKIFHDQAKEKKERLAREFNTNKDRLNKNQAQNIIVLISQFDKRMDTAIADLKALNKTKKKYDATAMALKKQIRQRTPKIEKLKVGIAQKMFAALELSRSGNNNPEIIIKGKACQGTVLGGAYSRHTLDQNRDAFCAKEIFGKDEAYTIRIQPTV